MVFIVITRLNCWKNFHLHEKRCNYHFLWRGKLLIYTVEIVNHTEETILEINDAYLLIIIPSNNKKSGKEP